MFFFFSRDFPQKMASALSENPASVIHSLNLAHNTLDNQGTGLETLPPTAVSHRAPLIVLLLLLLRCCFSLLSKNSKSMSLLAAPSFSVSLCFSFIYLSCCISMSGPPL